MDINSLLSSPQDPQSGHGTPAPPVSLRPGRSGSVRQGMTSSPLVHQVLAPSYLREPSPQVGSPTTGPMASSAAGTPPSGELRPARQPSTPGMDTLAELAAMQHHQPHRLNASVIRSSESYENQLSPSATYQNFNPVPRNTSTPRASLDLGLV